MSKQLTAVVDIAATAEQVRTALVDFDSYRQWTPFILDADGSASVGARLTLRMQPVGARAMTLKPVVQQVPFVRRSLERHTLPAFIAMNAALKAAVERGAYVNEAAR